MSLANYSDLMATALDIVDRAGDTRLNAAFPNLVTMVEGHLQNGVTQPSPNGMIEMAKPLRHSSMLAKVYLDTVIGTESYELPTDFLEMEYLYIDTPRTLLELRTPRDLKGLYQPTDQDLPRYFAQEGSNISLGPIPNDVYALQMLYYQQIPSLVTSTTNWLMTLAPNIYLSGVLAEICLYIQNAEGFQVYNGRFANEINGLMERDRKRKWSGGPLIMKPEYMGP